MTIVEALKVVLNEHPEGMTNKEAYEAIVRNGLYDFRLNNRNILLMV